ncbi:MAG TPA: phosphoribosylaminoimidazolesuccinocarboxamide synthase [Gemmatimonadaceae bacterium]|nr:phosphoribosylaminoimidazolesuccinocarboxamide synthase [Gemmatimonadaceae bacterium]
MTTIAASTLPLHLAWRGKVRDVYHVDDARVLLVTTDRISAFDVVMNETVPYKGAVLTQLTAWWLRQLERHVPHHMLSADADEIAREVPGLDAHRDAIRLRAMLCRRVHIVPIECVMRGYLAGSAWKEYKESGTLAGEKLPQGLTESVRLPVPLFSPATKAVEGHDENITQSAVRELVGPQRAAQLEEASRFVYDFGCRVAEAKGIIVADTKFEFGTLGDELVLADEVLTPDSSRFWPMDRYEPGRTQPSFDKQPLRDYLEGEKRAGRWNGDAPPPSLPPDVVDATSERYLDAFRRLTGSALDVSPIA